MPASLDPIFKPKSIAVVGASSREGTIGYVILNNLQRYNFKGQLYPVNPKADAIGSLKCYKSVLEIPEKVDLAIIVVPRDFVAQALEECGQRGVASAVTITSGFKEIGGDGIQKEQELIDILHKYKMRMVGPNCYGVVNTDPGCSLNGTFSKLNPLRGRIGFMSQSGALGEVVIDYTNKLNLGFSMFISVGNKADVSDIDVLKYWKDDPNTEVILLYLENIESPKETMQLAREISRRKPILAVKAGRTESGARAISSHTGVLAGGDVGTEAFFEKCGIIRVHAIDEMFDIAIGFAHQPLPKGDRIAVITNAGGPGILATDAVESLGLKLARFEPETIKFLRANLSPVAAVGNPIDVIASGGPDAYGAAMQAALLDRNVDGVIVIFVPPILVDHKAVICTIIERIQKYQNGKTVLACLMGSPGGIAGSDDLIAHHIPIYPFPEGAARAMSGMVKYSRWRQRPKEKIADFHVNRQKAESIVEAAIKSGQETIIGKDALTILEAYGIGVPGTMTARNEEEIDIALGRLRSPLVMKIDDPAAIHKTEIGGVALNLGGREEILAAFRQMKSRFSTAGVKFTGVMLQETVTGGVETIIGMNHDPSVGPLIMFGLGGISVEVMKDVAFKVHPLTDIEAEDMIKSVKGYSLLTGFRGARPVDLEKLKEAILRLSRLVSDFPQFASFDVNPFIATPSAETSMAVDARFVLKPRA